MPAAVLDSAVFQRSRVWEHSQANFDNYHCTGWDNIVLTHGPRLDNIFLQCAPPLSVILQCQRKTDAFLIARSVHVFVSLIWLSGKQLKYVARFGSEYLTVLPSCCFRGCSAFSLSS